MDIQKNLGMLDAAVFKSSFNRPNLFYEVRSKTNATKEIIRYIKSNPGKSGIIYCLSRKKVEELAELLAANSIKVAPYHAGMDAVTRAANQDAFLNEKVDVRYKSQDVKISLFFTVCYHILLILKMQIFV